MLPALQELSMGSLDMRHTLTWRPLAVPCSTATLYTVQFQGEFERSILNDSWLDAPQCRRTPRTHCDLTSDLGSDSDYGVRVRAECGQQVSLWARLSGLFNRRDASLSPPEMAVEALGDGVRISFQRLPQTASVNITASTDVLPADQTALLVAALQEGGVYCVQAWTYLDPQRRSPEEPWKKPTVAMVTAVATVTLLLAVLCDPIGRQSDGRVLNQVWRSVSQLQPSTWWSSPEAPGVAQQNKSHLFQHVCCDVEQPSLRGTTVPEGNNRP
ncbi:hypothetical protein NHX12_004939 [Muraenolepis orangiensis]|uniref:Fibronectin type-III domain-containing protein n=1 Tax=Muraenolepis orangiensis TaxID=630683 RepID=A0A9Q0DXR1_9TELE|nr:hypothetical protein NHX12_004939 [Muraenolepis orangiensis]